MADRKTTLYSGFWSHGRTERWDEHQKLLYLYLISNDRCSSSGVYYITRERIHFESRVPKIEIDRNLVIDPMDGITYDARLNVCFAHSKLKRSLSKGGARDIIAKSIIADYYANYKAVSIWRLFVEKYKDQVDSNALLKEHFAKVNLVGDPGSAPFLIGSSLTPHAEQSTTEELELNIQRELNRYVDLPQDDLTRIGEVVEEFSRRRGGQQLVAPQTRLERIKVMSQFPVEQVARAAYLYKNSGTTARSPWAFFETILKGDAEAWYKDFTKARKNGNRRQGRADGGESASAGS